MEIACFFLESNKLNGSENYISWSFKAKTMLRRDEVFEEVVKNGPPIIAPTSDNLKTHRKKTVKAINIFQVTVKYHLIPTMREYEDDPHGLWEHLK